MMITSLQHVLLKICVQFLFLWPYFDKIISLKKEPRQHFPTGIKTFLCLRTFLKKKKKQKGKLSSKNETRMRFSPFTAHFPLRLLKPSRTQIRARPCSRSLAWVLSKKDCGSAGCPLMEARTPASLTSPLKVCVGGFCWATFQPIYKRHTSNICV